MHLLNFLSNFYSWVSKERKILCVKLSFIYLRTVQEPSCWECWKSHTWMNVHVARAELRVLVSKPCRAVWDGTRTGPEGGKCTSVSVQKRLKRTCVCSMYIAESGTVIRSKWRWSWKGNFVFCGRSFLVSYCSERLLTGSSTNCPEPHALPLSDYRIFTSLFFFESWQHNGPGQCQIIICTLARGAGLLYESEEDKNSTLKAGPEWLNKRRREEERDLNAVCWAGWFFAFCLLAFNFISSPSHHVLDALFQHCFSHFVGLFAEHEGSGCAVNTK